MKQKLKTKDFIYAGAFGAVYLILVLLIVTGTGIVPILYILSPLVAGCVCASVFMLSYPIFNLTMVGPFLILIYAKAHFIELSSQYYGAEYAQSVDRLTPGWIIFVLMGLAVAGGAIGDLLAASGENCLKNINFEVKKGEFIVLCGRSGCGKTTLTRVLNGLIPHFYEGKLEGAVKAEGLNVSEAELSRTADLIGSVFQNPSSQFFHMDTDGELSFGCENLAMEPGETSLNSRMTG